MIGDCGARYTRKIGHADRAMMDWLVASCDLYRIHRGFLKIKPRIARVELRWVSIAQVAEKIDLPLAVRKKCRIQFLGVEPDIGPQSNPKRVQPG